VLLLSGKITLILQLHSGQKSVTLQEIGSYIIVPKGIWHTAKTTIKSKLLFITAGEGTLNKEESE
jgi:oxalate decarboxylase/phosphoglucose isomerase-like protein (cupin superfamily)